MATKYTLNLLDYALGSFDDANAPALASSTTKEISFTVAKDKISHVDLKPYANMGFADEVANDKTGGWSDQGPENDARTMPVGLQTFAGVPFEIIDPAKNQGKSCIVLQGDKMTKTEFLPKELKRIVVNRKAKKIYFLVSGTWVPADYMRVKNESMASLDIGMDIRGEGTIQKNRVELVPGKNFGDWWNIKPVSEAAIGWRGLAGKKDALKEVGAYVVEWINPEPQVTVGWIDFSSAGRAVPILIGVTCEL